MMNNASCRKAESRRFGIALAISLALHAAVLWKFGMLPPGLPSTHSGPLQVRLPATAAETTAPVEVQELAVPEGMPAPQEARIAAADSVRVNAPVVPKVAAEAAADVPAPRVSAAAPEAVAQPAGLPRSGPAGAARRVEIEFETFSGADRQPIGRGRHLYLSANDQSFGVSIKEVSRPDETAREASWQLDISGRIDRQGLSPLVFAMQGALPERFMSLKEAAGGQSSLPGKTRSGRMPDGILDRQSLLYQFMLVPPSNSGGKLWLSDGVKNALYSYSIAGYETLAVPPIGNVQVLKLVFSTAGSAEIIELWLIPDKRYLPAKMRHTDRLGVITEQVVMSLDSD
jgi:hypothetical protein